MMTLRFCAFALATILIMVAGCSDDSGKQPQSIPTTPTAPAPPPPQPTPVKPADAAAPTPIEDARAATEADAGSEPDKDVEKDEPADPKDGPPKNLKVLPKKWSRKQVTDYMKTKFRKGLGVKCKYCHEKDDFASDKNKHKRIARKMMRMTSAMDRKYFKGKKKLTCFTCHQGKKKAK